MCYRHTTTKAFRNCICAIGCKNCDDFLNYHSFGSQDRKKKQLHNTKEIMKCWPWDDWVEHLRLLLFLLKEDFQALSASSTERFTKYTGMPSWRAIAKTKATNILRVVWLLWAKKRKLPAMHESTTKCKKVMSRPRQLLLKLISLLSLT